MMYPLVNKYYGSDVCVVVHIFKIRLNQMLQSLVHDIYIAVTQVTAMYKHYYILVVTNI